MNAREKKFAEFYAENGNAYQSALKAGYAESTAAHANDWIVKNPKKPDKFKPYLAEYIQTLSEAAQRQRIINAIQRQEILSDIAADGAQETADRIKAIDTLNKMTGEYVTKVQAEVDIPQIIVKDDIE